MWRHRVLLLLWGVTFAALALGFVVAAPFAVLAHFAAMALAFVTAVRADRVGVLRYALVYRASLVLLLLATATTLVGAGSTVAFRGEGGITLGLITLAATNLAAAILAWRALTRPAPKRAAGLGTFVVVAELTALIIDASISLTAGYNPDALGVVALITSYVATWIGALVCIAALVAFEPAPMYVVPSARVVDADGD